MNLFLKINIAQLCFLDRKIVFELIIGISFSIVWLKTKAQDTVFVYQEFRYDVLNKETGEYESKIFTDKSLVPSDAKYKSELSFFVESNKNTPLYNWMETYYDSVFLGENLCKQCPKIQFPKHFDKTWYPLRKFKNRYHLFVPNESSYSDFEQFRENYVIKSFMGGTPACISNFKILDQYTISYTETYWNESYNIIFHLIDPKYQIAIKEYSNDNKSSYTLLIGCSHIRDIPIITTERRFKTSFKYLELEKIDFESLFQIKPLK